MPTLSSFPLAAGINQGLQVLVQEWGIRPVKFDPAQDLIVYGPADVAVPAIEPFYKLHAPTVLRAEGGAPGQPKAAARRGAAAGEIAKAVRSLEVLMTKTHRLQLGAAKARPLGPLGSRSARQILAEMRPGGASWGVKAVKLADFAGRLCIAAFPQGAPTSDLRFLGAALLAGIERQDPLSRRNQAADAFAHVARLFRREERYGAAALAAEWGLATFIGDPGEFRGICEGGRMWAESLRRAPRGRAQAEAFYHGLNYAFRTGDTAAEIRLFASLADWHARGHQWLEGAGCSLRAAVLVSPYGVDVTGEPKETIDQDDVVRYAIEVAGHLTMALAMFTTVRGEEAARETLERFILDAAKLQVNPYASK